MTATSRYCERYILDVVGPEWDLVRRLGPRARTHAYYRLLDAAVIEERETRSASGKVTRREVRRVT